MSDTSSDNIDRFFKVRARAHGGLNGYNRAGYRWPRGGEEYRVVELVERDDPRIGTVDAETNTLMIGPGTMAQLRADAHIEIFAASEPATAAERDWVRTREIERSLANPNGAAAIG